MEKFNYIYCQGCKRFHFVEGFDFGDGNKRCPLCFNVDIKSFESNSYSEVSVQIERKMKINKIFNK